MLFWTTLFWIVAISLFSMMPQPYERQEESVPLSHYLTGIALLAKTDVFLQFEIQSYGAFVQSIDSALNLYRPKLHLDLQPKDMAW